MSAQRRRGGMFSVALAVENFPPLRRKRARMGQPPPGRYPAHRSLEFGLSSLRVRDTESDRPVQLPTALLYARVYLPSGNTASA
jgi:hypothetical protein